MIYLLNINPIIFSITGQPSPKKASFSHFPLRIKFTKNINYNPQKYSLSFAYLLYPIIYHYMTAPYIPADKPQDRRTTVHPSKSEVEKYQGKHQ